MKYFLSSLERFLWAMVVTGLWLEPRGQHSFFFIDAAVREYVLVVHHQDVDRISARTGESVSRLGVYVNETYPGPTLTADLGDEVVIKVVNEMPNSETVLHFHGQHQVGTYYMDGVPHVTQCAIRPMSSFEYRFTAEPAGTFFYHSHMPYQFGDGVFGAFIVQDPQGDPYHLQAANSDKTVNQEVVVALSDWLRYYSDVVYQYTSQFRFDFWPLAHYVSLMNGAETEFRFSVAPGSVTRLRVYCATIEYGYRLYATGGHRFTVVAADGSLVRPVEVDYLDLYSGERYDILLEANQEPGAYLLIANVISYTGVLQDEVTYGTFVYDDVDVDSNATLASLQEQLAAFNNSDNALTLLDQYELVAYRDDATGDFAPGYETVPGPAEVMADLVVYKTTSFAVQGERQYAFMDSWDNHFNAKPSSALPFVADNNALQDLAARESRTMNVAAYSDNTQTHTATFGPRFEFLELNQVVDIVFQNAPTPGNELSFFGAVHPMHVHGHYFWSLASGKGAFDPTEAAAKANFIDPPLRDNVVVHSDSWVLVRLKASNAGIWLMHCHSETHAIFGMMTTLVVGTADERPDLPDGFSFCGALPPVPAAPPLEDSTDASFARKNTVFVSGIMAVAILVSWTMVG